MQSKTHDERAAMVLATAIVIGDEAAALRHGCSTRSIQRWRATCEEDESLSSAVASARARMEQNWVDEVPRAILSAIEYLSQATIHLPKDCPESVEAVVKAVDTLAIVVAHQKMLDARLAGQNRAVRAEPFTVVAGGSGAAKSA